MLKIDTYHKIGSQSTSIWIFTGIRSRANTLKALVYISLKYKHFSFTYPIVGSHHFGNRWICCRSRLCRRRHTHHQMPYEKVNACFTLTVCHVLYRKLPNTRIYIEFISFVRMGFWIAAIKFNIEYSGLNLMHSIVQ